MSDIKKNGVLARKCSSDSVFDYKQLLTSIFFYLNSHFLFDKVIKEYRIERPVYQCSGYLTTSR